MAGTSETPWHDHFSKPQSIAASISRAEVLKMLHDGKIPGRDFLLIDLRRSDHEGGTIRGSLNLPAQTFWYSLATLYDLCSNAGISEVIFYCGSSRGRGTRAAGWFEDECVRRGAETVKAFVLADGIRGWVDAGEEYRAQMEGFVEEVWTGD